MCCIGKLFLLPEAAANICKLPVAVVRQSSAVAQAKWTFTSLVTLGADLRGNMAMESVGGIYSSQQLDTTMSPNLGFGVV